MRVVLRNPYTPDGRHHWSLTVGGSYEVLGIANDAGEPVLFDPECFEVVDPAEPPFWSSTFGEEGERYAYPPGWGVAGFFERWHDRDPIIRRLFAEQLAYWYPDALPRSG